MDCAEFRVRFVSAIDGLADGDVALDTRYRELPVWDSLAVICILAMVDGEYGVSLTAADLNSVETVRELALLVEKRKF